MKPLFVAYALLLTDNALREVLRKHRAAKIYDRTSGRLLILYILFLLASPAFGLLDILVIQQEVVLWWGVGLMVVGILGHMAAMRQLQAFYTGNLAITSHHQLITTGPYRIVRHPGYLANLIVSIGFGLATGSWIALASIVALFGVVYGYRMQIEERMLTQKFGQKYQKYTQTTSRIIPWIY